MWLREPSKKRLAYLRLARRHGNICSYCGVPLTEPDDEGRPRPTTRTLDHYHPRSRGGTNRLVNLVLACVRCNEAKGSQLPLEFLITRMETRPA
jgi:5-methylcytosine-specific restriction endonuclease McrA